jgi:hypothetical protein
VRRLLPIAVSIVWGCLAIPALVSLLLIPIVFGVPSSMAAPAIYLTIIATALFALLCIVAIVGSWIVYTRAKNSASQTAPNMRIALACLPLPIVFVIAAVHLGPSAVVSQSETETILNWATKQGVKPSTVGSSVLPSGLVWFGAGDTIDIAHLKDNRYCFLLRTVFYGHDYSNWEGVMSCSGPVLQSEIFPPENAYPRTISLTGCKPGCGAFEQLFVRRQRNDHTFDVYFDLN